MKHRTFGNRKAQQGTPRRRRRGTARLFVLGATFMASTAIGGIAPTAYAQGTPAATAQMALRFDVAAGPIADVVRGFEAVTGLTVSYANESIRDLPSPGVAGMFTSQRALEQLLMGTGVTAMFTATGVTLDIRAAEFVA